MKVTISNSTNPKKKLMAIFTNDDGKKVKTSHFGQAGADDYTITKDKEQRARYRNRHKKDLDTNDYKKAGYLSWYLLWNKPTLTESIKDYKKRFNLN
tara:strand:- start:787 stop:1077 length:291 start_codon:yes stop_codon:yes gene_type:complete